jgi:AcrR family transcriptional regulator
MDVKGETRSRREEYSEATREALLDAATQLFAESGFTRTSLDDICAAARVTKGALYHHYDGKQSLFEAAMDRLENVATERIATAALAAAGPWEAALAGLDAFLDNAADSTYCRLVFSEGPAALGWNRWRECEDRHAWGLTETLLRGLVEAKVVPPMPLESATRVAIGMLSAAALAIAEAPEAERKQRRDEMAELLTRLFSGLRIERTSSSRPRPSRSAR